MPFWGLRLVAEHVHPIRHCLLGFPGEPVRRAISHPQALAQTRRYLEAHDIEAIPIVLQNITGGYGGAHCLTCPLTRS